MKRLFSVLVVAGAVGAALLAPAKSSSTPLCSSLQHTSCPGFGSQTDCETDWGEVAQCSCIHSTPGGPFWWECPV